MHAHTPAEYHCRQSGDTAPLDEDIRFIESLPSMGTLYSTYHVLVLSDLPDEIPIMIATIAVGAVAKRRLPR